MPPPPYQPIPKSVPNERRVYIILAGLASRPISILTNESKLQDDLDLKFLDIVEFVMFLEDEFEIVIDEDSFAMPGVTIGKVIETVNALIASKSAT